MSKKLLVMLYLLTLFLFEVPLCKCELEWTTTYEIRIDTDCSATWVIERRAFLITDYDVAEFFNYSSLESLSEFTQTIQVMVGEAWQRTGRDMNVKDFEITFNLFNATIGYYGTIKYEFDWIGFAKNENGTIKIGDVFDGQYIDLLQEGTLIIDLPEGYMAVSSPQGQQIGRTLKWYGPKDFSFQEPVIILQQDSSSFWEVLRNYSLAIIGMAILGMASVSVWMFKLRKKNKVSTDIYPLENILKNGNGENEIIKMLNDAGGSLLQSTITNMCGFSKAKTSLLLKKLEKEGKVIRRKKGREKLVTLLTK
jgi:hypothetical protein